MGRNAWMAWAPVGTRSQFQEKKAASPTEQRKYALPSSTSEPIRTARGTDRHLTAGLQYKVDHRNDQAHALPLWKLDQSKNGVIPFNARADRPIKKCEKPGETSIRSPSLGIPVFTGCTLTALHDPLPLTPLTIDEFPSLRQPVTSCLFLVLVLVLAKDADLKT